MFIRKEILAAIGGVILLIFIVLFLVGQREPDVVVVTPGITPAPVTATPTPTTLPRGTLTPSPSPQSSPNITVITPRSGDTVSSPLVVRGQARTFEQNVNFRLRQSDGKVLVEDFTTAQAEDLGIFGPYSKTLTFSSPTTQTGTLEVFQVSPKDGSEIDKVTVNVRFASAP